MKSTLTPLFFRTVATFLAFCFVLLGLFTSNESFAVHAFPDVITLFVPLLWVLFSGRYSASTTIWAILRKHEPQCSEYAAKMNQRIVTSARLGVACACFFLMLAPTGLYGQSCASSFTDPDFRTEITRVEPSNGVGWIPGPFCSGGGVSSQKFTNWQGSGMDVTFNYSDNMWDGDAPNIYVAPGDEALMGPGCAGPPSKNGVNDSHCATSHHGALRWTNNTGDVGGPPGTPSGPSQMELVFSGPSFLDFFRVGSISMLESSNGVKRYEWAHIKAFDGSGNQLNIPPSAASSGYIICDNTEFSGGLNIISDGSGGLYVSGSDIVAQSDSEYGFVDIELPGTIAISRVTVDQWISSSSTDPTELGLRNQLGSILINVLCFSQACPLVLVSSSTNPTCPGSADGSINLTVFDAVGLPTFLWSNGSTTEDISGLTAGTYTVTVTDPGSGDCTATKSVTITDPTGLGLIAVPSASSSCVPQNGTINLTVTGGDAPYTYLWSDGQTVQDPLGLGPGTYTVTVTDADMCTATTSATVTGPNSPSVSFVPSNVSCFGGSDGSINTTGSGGVGPYTYLWSNGATDEDLSGLMAGMYSVTITDNVGCTGTGMTTVGQPAAPVSVSLQSITTTDCVTGTIDINVSGGTGPYTYDWSNDGPESPDNDNQDLMVNAPGTYTVTVTDANGCTETLTADYGGCDWGDLPDTDISSTYPTNANNGGGQGVGPSHVIITGLKLGATVDSEGDGQPNAMASGDGGDEDSFIPASVMFVAGQSVSVTLPLMNMTGGDAKVAMFIDFNKDGDLNDANEMFSTTVANNATSATLTVVVPTDAILNMDLGARIRLSTNMAAAMNPTGFAPDGEVEDYLVMIMGYDYGDLADGSAGTGTGNYNTSSSDNGPSHKIIDGLKLGASVDAEVDGQPSADALGDGADENGVSLPMFIAGVPADITVNYMNMTGVDAKLTVFIDWNNNGSFLDPGEMYSTTVTSGSSSTLIPVLPPIFTIFNQNLAIRVRLSTDFVASMLPTGPAPDGEVEDYLGQFMAYDWGDLNDNAAGTATAGTGMPANYETLASDNGPSHKIITDILGNVLLKIGSTIDPEANGQSDNDAGKDGDGDDGVGLDDEDGLDYNNMPLFILTQPVTLNIPVMNMTGQSAKLTAYIDFNKDGDFTDAGEMFSASVPDGATSAAINLTVPMDAVVGDDLGLRLRLNYATEPMNPTGQVQSGEIEDYVIQVIGFDFGDLPETYGTSGPGAPSHIVNENLKLGSCVDSELDGQPNNMAGLMTGGDDGNVGLATFGTCEAPGDDENGIKFVTPMIAGANACIEVTAMNMTGDPAVLQMWVDFNGDGDMLDAGEEVTFTSPGGGTIPDGGVTNQEFCFDVPADATFTGAQAMVRFRLSPDGGLAPNTQSAPVPFGEIEDYKLPLAKIGNFVWWDYDNDGIQDAGEPGINDVEVQLTWLGPDGQLGGGDDIVTTQTTATMGAEDGMYMFLGLTPGAYKLSVISTPDGFAPTMLDQGGNDVLDSDDPAGVMVMIPNPIDLPLDENGTGDNPDDPNFPDPTNDLTYDFGFIIYDFGDLPDTYGTTENNNGPSMILNPNLYLGTCVDGESDGQPEPMAGMMIGGDDNNNNPATVLGACTNGDDENGLVLFETPMIPGYVACWRVTAQNTTGEDAVLQAWVDFNGNGTFEAGEELTSGSFAPNGYVVPNGGITNQQLCFDVPADATFTGGQAMIRLRLSQNGGMDATGPAMAGDFGEVEDYKLQLAKIGNLVWNDYNNDGIQNEPTTAGLNDIAVNLTWAGPDLAFNTPDDQVYETITSNMGVDGQYMFLGLIPGPYKVDLPMLPTGYQVTQIDQGSDVTDSDDPSGQMVMIPDPINLPLGENGTGDEPNDPNFPDPLNDLTIDFGIITTDFGDLPDTYGTTDGSPNDGPVHVIDPRIKLGACIDGELDGHPDGMAGLMTGGDDNTDGAGTDGQPSTCGNDEDGIVFETPMVPGYEACIRVTAMNMLDQDAVLQMWVDWNGNDQFDAGEEVNTGDFAGGGANIPVNGVTDELYCFQVPVDASFTGASARIRFRLSPNGGLSPNGPENMPFPQGEVEDYKLPLAKVGNLVWNDWNNDGQQNEPDNAGLNNIGVQLVWAGPDGDFNTTADNLTYSQMTSNMGVDGMYMFTGLISGAYKASIPALPANFIPTQIDLGSDVTDSDDPAGVMVMIPDPIDLPLGENGTGDNPNDPNFPDPNNDLTFDFGLITTDYGDLPDTYSTTDAEDGPVHVVNPFLKLGACEDGEADGQPDGMAGLMTGGDDNGTGSNVDGVASTCGDDEDGVVFETPMIPGYTACIRVTAMNMLGAPAKLQMWVDWNGNDQFDVGEEVNTMSFAGGGATIPNGGVNDAQFCFEVPTDASFTGGSARIRFRLSPNGGLPSDGPAMMPYPIGEVEDYKLPLAKVGNYVWIDVNNNGQQDENGILGINGVTVQLEWAGPDGSILTTADNLVYEVVTAPKNAQINGIYYFCGLIPGTYEISVPPFGYVPSMLNVGDDVTDSDDPAGVMVIIPNPIDLITDEYGTGDMPGMLHDFPDNQEDQTYDFGYLGFDLGDLPDTYGTTMGNNGAIHTVNPDLFLGPCVDVELDGQPEAMAGFMTGGDDGNAGPGFLGTCSPAGDDENGISFPTPLIPGNEACVKVTVTNTTGAPAVLEAWIDFNGNGTLEAVEELTTGDFAPGGAVIPVGGVANQNFCFNVPADARFEGGNLFSRFRLSDVGGLNPVGPAFPGNGMFPTGEVEDYKLPLALIGNYVWMDNPDIEGDQDVDEMMLADVKLNLIWSGEDNVFQTPAMSATPLGDDRVYMVTTDALGLYLFRGLIPNTTYRILPEKYTAPNGAAGAQIIPLNKILTIPNLPANDNLDSDAMPFIPVSIPDLVTGLLPIDEDGLKDNNGQNGFPDNQENLSLDLGFIDEPEIRAAMAILGFEETTCGEFGVIMDLCIKNNSTAPLANIQAMLDLASANAYGTAFLGVIGTAEIVSSTAQQNPGINAGYTGLASAPGKNLFDGTSGLLWPGEQICIRIKFGVDPDIAGAPAFPKAQAMVSGKAQNFQGVPIPDYWNGGAQYMAMDLSDSGLNPMSNNPGAPGDTGGSDDPTPLGNCWQTTQQLACNDLVHVSIDSSCSALVTPSMFLEGEDPNCDEDNYPLGGFTQVTIKTLTGQIVPNPIPASYFGQTLVYSVKHIMSCNSCWGNLIMEDKLPPILTCPADVTVACSESISPINTGQIGILDCTNTTTVIDDDVLDNGECGNPRQVITRTFIVTDSWANQSLCQQTITVTPFDLADLVMPADITIDCETAYLNPQATAPTVTGQPSINGAPIGTSACAATFGYTDVVLNGCAGSTEILRTWTVKNSCLPIGPGNPVTHTQLIRVRDIVGPTFVCPPAVTVSTNPFQCCATAALPSMIVSEGCSNISNLEATVTGVNPNNGNIITFTVGGTLADFPGNNYWNPDTLAVFNYTQCMPLGDYTVEYEAQDECGNVSTCNFILTVADLVPPTVSCDQFTQVALINNGEAIVNASTFDDGTTDNCCLDFFEVARMDGGACTGTSFGPDVQFCCSDINDTIIVVFRAWDCHGNSNDCMVSVLVEDKIKPVCQAPAQVNVNCEAFDPSLWSYGIPDVMDNCCLDTNRVYQGQIGLTHSVNYALFDTVCNRGTITRTFRTFDCAGNSSQCTQRVIVTYEQDYFVKFPNDVIVNVCDGTGVYGEPLFFGEDCELLGVSFVDEIFTVVPDACFKIERTWKIINWCTFDPNQPFIQVPNPNPNATSNHPSNLPGPTVSACGTIAPWAPTSVRIYPNDPSPTNYCTFYNKNANGYEYKQIIKIIDGQAPTGTFVVPECSNQNWLTPNSNQLWNEMYWWDNGIQTHDLCEEPTDLCITATDACSGSNVNIEYLLFLDLDNDGVMETVVNSVNTGLAGLGWNNVLFGNANTPNFLGGTSRQFDERAVAANQKYGFSIQETVLGNNKTACVRWNTQQQQNNFVVPELPHGTHKIKWFVTDGCGNNAEYEYTFTVKDCKAPTVVCLNGLSVNIMPTGMITLWASDFLQYTEDNCTPTDQIKIGIRKCGTGTGFPVDAQGNPITNVTFDCTELGDQCVELWAMDAAGNADFCETYVMVQDNFGGCIPGNNVVVSGALKTEVGDGVEEAVVEISTPSVPFLTGADGVYSLIAPMGATATITPSKDDNPLNGVTTYDLVLISKHILGLEPLTSPYKMIAADANKSGSITTFDIVEIRKLILGIYTELPANTSWRFVDKSFQFPNLNNPFETAFPETITRSNMLSHQVDQDFVGVKVGDLNGTAVANATMAADDRTQGTAIFDIQDRAVVAGEEFEVTFRAAELLKGFQFTATLNGLKAIGTVDGDHVSASNFNLLPANAMAVSIDGAQAFTARFRAEKAGKLSQMLGVSGEITRAEAYPASELNPSTLLNKKDVAFRFDGKTIAGVGFELYQNQPNPFVNKTSIGFFLPEATEATLSIMDEAGRLVYQQKGQFAKGHNVILLERALLSTTGVLYYKLDTETDSATRKMIQAK